MLNTDVVNSKSKLSRYTRIFAFFFLVSGRILYFKNPVKYTRIFEINQSMGSKMMPAARGVPLNNSSNIRYLQLLTFTQDNSAILLQNRRSPLQSSKMDRKSSLG